MNCSIISVGTEILFGQIVNTNSVFLSQELNYLGFNVLYHYTVGDNAKRLKEILLENMGKVDLIITTGGLGPTQDDITKEIIAEVFDEKLVEHQPSMNNLTSFFQRLNRTMTPNNIKQAYLPENAIVFPNDRGTAPGFAIEKNNKIAIVLPGPPHEMKHIYATQVKAYLLKKSEEVIFYKVLRFFGIGESALEAEIEDLITYQTDPTLAPYAKKGGVSLRIASKKRSLTEAEKAVDEMIDKVKGKLDRYLYSVDNEELVDVVARKLIERNISIATAESCTGGGLASALTDIPGISQVFHSGYVTYSNEAKMDTLGVKEETLHTYGAVSEETAVEMAEGLFKKTKSDLCIAITGIAGPGGGTATKPVGLTYIALKYKDKTICKEYKLAFQSREQNRNYSILLMLHLINKNI